MEELKNGPVLLEEGKNQEKRKTSSEKKIKNLISLSILLGGLFIGSIFVDIIQLVRGEGFSQRILNKTDIFNLNDKTWVAYSDPVVKIQVISDDTCETCQPDQALVWLRRVVPTIMPERIDQNSEEGKALVKSMGIKTIPAFIFSKEIENTDFYQQASMIFIEKDGEFVLQTSELGLSAGKYIETPAISEDDIQIGNKEAKVKIIQFSDFQCPYCRAFHTSSIQKMIQEYGDKILFVFKQFPLDFHPQAENAALASECANEQEKFLVYADKLFEDQSNWGNSEGTQQFKSYAQQLGLDTSQFNQCLDDSKYQGKIANDLEEGREFGVSGTPATFINNDFKNGVVGYDELKSVIDEELAKE